MSLTIGEYRKENGKIDWDKNKLEMERQRALYRTYTYNIIDYLINLRTGERLPLMVLVEIDGSMKFKINSKKNISKICSIYPFIDKNVIYSFIDLLEKSIEKYESIEAFIKNLHYMSAIQPRFKRYNITRDINDLNYVVNDIYFDYMESLFFTKEEVEKRRIELVKKNDLILLKDKIKN